MASFVAHALRSRHTFRTVDSSSSDWVALIRALFRSQPFEYFVTAERDVNAHCAPCDEMAFSSFGIGAMIVAIMLIVLVLVSCVLMRRCPERAMRLRRKVITLADEYTALNKLKVSIAYMLTPPLDALPLLHYWPKPLKVY